MKRQQLALVPAAPDGPQGLDELGHPLGGMVEGRAEPAGDVGADLRAEAEVEPAGRVPVELVGQVRDDHRVAGQGHGDGRAQLDPGGVLGGEGQRQERLGMRLQRAQAAKPR